MNISAYLGQNKELCVNNIKSWLSNLSVVGRTSLIIALAAGGLITVSAVSPKSDTSNTNSTKNSKAVTKTESVTTTKTEEKTDVIPFDKKTIESGDLAKGTTNIQVAGANGIKTTTYTITLVDGIEKSRTSIEKVTLNPVSEIIAVGTYVKPVPTCDSNYSDCVPIASDVDCAGGSGNGPAYTSGPVRVIGSDIYGLDRDGDGWGCE